MVSERGFKSGKIKYNSESSKIHRIEKTHRTGEFHNNRKYCTTRGEEKIGKSNAIIGKNTEYRRSSERKNKSSERNQTWRVKSEYYFKDLTVNY